MTRTGRLLVTLAVNVALVGGELASGIVARSTGLLADAGHNVTDVAAVLLSLAAVRWALRPRSDVRSFGNHRGTILAALANAALLAVMTCAILAISIDRLLYPSPAAGTVVGVVAGIALFANGAVALVLSKEAHDLNMRSVLVHMTSDAAASLVVMVAGIVVAIGGRAFDRADPAASLVVGLLILVEAVRVLRESADVLLESTPADVDLPSLRAAVTAVPGVAEVHDLHVWSLSSDYRALSAHLVLTGHPTLEEAQEVGGRVRAELTGTFDIAHTTFEMECERCDDDAVDPCAVGPFAADDHHAEPTASGRLKRRVVG